LFFRTCSSNILSTTFFTLKSKTASGSPSST
jgi:hypothetical protein